MDAETVERWLDGYVRAWESNVPEDIGGLFAEDAWYFTAPYREPWEGREDIVRGWRDRRDQAGEWEFRHEPPAIADQTAFVRGWTRYSNGEHYSNLWVIRFDDDERAVEFVEWWMEESTTEA